MGTTINHLDETEFAKVIANYILDEAKNCIAKNDLFKLVLSGGNTPKLIFKELVKNQSQIAWDKVEIYWVDERCVPIDSIDSNYGNCKKYLLSYLDVSPRAYPMYREGSPEQAAKDYQHLLEANFELDSAIRFDLVLLGLGPDGHVASLFPNSEEINQPSTQVLATVSPLAPQNRITLSFYLINSTAKSVIVAKGSEKKWVFEACMKSTPDFKIPACHVRPELGDIVWFVSF